MKSKYREQLEQQGYCIVGNVFDLDMIEKIRQWCNKGLATVSENHRNLFKAQGCLVDIADYPDFSELIAHPALAALFRQLDLHNMVFSSGSIISKPPHSPALFWHHDWWGWDDPISYTERIPQVNIMIYLSATTPEHGCLRVIPGSHRNRHPIHENPTAYDAAISKVENPDHPLFQSCSEEVAVNVKPGDVVVKDTRLLHGAYANTSGQERTMLSLNFNPDFSNLPAAMQARINSIFMRDRVKLDGVFDPNNQVIAQWPEAQRRPIEHLFPNCADSVAAQDFNFSPNLQLLNCAEKA